MLRLKMIWNRRQYSTVQYKRGVQKMTLVLKDLLPITGRGHHSDQAWLAFLVISVVIQQNGTSKEFFHLYSIFGPHTANLGATPSPRRPGFVEAVWFRPYFIPFLLQIQKLLVSFNDYCCILLPCSSKLRHPICESPN